MVLPFVATVLLGGLGVWIGFVMVKIGIYMGNNPESLGMWAIYWLLIFVLPLIFAIYIYNHDSKKWGIVLVVVTLLVLARVLAGMFFIKTDEMENSKPQSNLSDKNKKDDRPSKYVSVF